MSRKSLASGALALALFAATPSWAASDADLAQIRDEIRQLKENYEARIQSLEARLKDAEAAAAKPVPSAPVAAPAALAGSSSSGIAAFNPAISAVLQGRYANFSQDPEKYAISGFAAGGEIGPGKRGFSLGESELAISANVDDKFAGNLIVSLTPENTVSVEEAYGILTALPDGLTPKFGRFFLGVG